MMDWRYILAATSAGRDITPDEEARFNAGRSDWREADWEDECGVPDCGHSCCEVYWGLKEPTRI